jgi:SAM-dependent methyltransferase/thioredoxin-like negative regulator of GroEL
MNRKERRAAGKAAARSVVPGESLEGVALAHFQDGNRLAQQGRFEQAAALYRRALVARPDYACAHSNLGNCLVMLGQTDGAIEAWRDASAADPTYALPLSNLGNALSQQGRLDEAIGYLRRAIDLKPDFVDALDHLARTLLAAGQAAEAMQIARRAIAIKPTPETRKIFVDCLPHVALASDDPALRAVLVEALKEPWTRPARLIGPAAALARRNPAVAACIERSLAARPARLVDEALWSPAAREALCGDPLLRALMLAGPICDEGIEWFLTTARSVLLGQALAAATMADDEAVLAFWCALARQCFINEYVFLPGDGELDAAERLAIEIDAALAEGRDVSPLWLAALGAYRPLHALENAAALLSRSWPPAVQALLVQQVQEPREEMRDRAAIPVLTTIEDATSRAVRAQYEENPYPRWIELPPSSRFETFAQYLNGILPWCDGAPRQRGEPCDILVAGCGTGQHAIDVARRSADARVLAIDLSLSSLAYARRKTRALALGNIDYAQADILQAGAIGRSFDVIESGGVLHHLADPMAGWRALLALLRPGGIMFVALYSARARSGVAAVRDFVAERGYGAGAADIRRFRHDLMAAREALPLGNLLTSPDFFSTSGCRDLFFHAMEHRLTLPEIKTFLDEQRLAFLGFQTDAGTLQRFRRRFPDAAALTDIDRWHAFECDHPQTFAAMYHFWVRKAG